MNIQKGDKVVLESDITVNKILRDDTPLLIYEVISVNNPGTSVATYMLRHPELKDDIVESYPDVVTVRDYRMRLSSMISKSCMKANEVQRLTGGVY